MQLLRRIYGIKSGSRCLVWIGCLLTNTALLGSSLQSCPAAEPAFAQAPALLDNMDSTETSLHPLPVSSAVQILQHDIDRNTYKHGTGAERLKIACPAGHQAQLAYKIPKAPVIDEFRAVAWLYANRPGVQLAAKVTLPRTQNTSTGKPYELLVRSSTVSRGGNWEPLTLENVPALLARVARVARAQFGGSIDERGAYVTQIVVLAPSGPGVVDLIVDRLAVYGIASATKNPNLPNNRTDSPQVAGNHAVGDQQQYSSANRGVPQIIQWQGEPFELLAKLGFNTIGMSRLPSEKELEETKKLGLSIVCPPPTPRQLTESGIPDELADVVAWDLGSQLTETDLDQLIRWQRLVERYDPIASRTSIITPQLFTRKASRISDTLLLGRGMLGSNISLKEYSTWLSHRHRVARPGTQIWSSINTQVSPQLSRQMTTLGCNGGSNTFASYQELTAQCSATFSSRSQGFYFRSETSLALADSTTQRRAKALELNNLRLRLAKPWLAAGKLLAPARSSQAQVTALVMQAERSHLLIPVNWSSTMQQLQSFNSSPHASFIVPGVSESAEAYQITLGGAQRIRKRRVTGGINVTLEDLPTDGFILLTDDPQAFSQVSRYLRKIAPRATQLRQELAMLRHQETTNVAKSLNQNSGSVSSMLAQADGELRTCSQARDAKSFEQAYQHADQAERLLEQCEQLLIAQSSTQDSPATFTSAPNFGIVSLPAQIQFQKGLARSPVGKNLLSGGGFENLQSLLQQGWRHQQLPIKGITTTVRLSPEAAHSGSYCLELIAQSSDEAHLSPIVPSSPVWITSPPLPVKVGEVVEITGVVRVPEPLLGTVDGVQIIDSLGGIDMSLRIPHAPSWTPFRLIRAVPTNTDVTVSIALTGLGTAQIDDLAIRTVQMSAQQQPAQAAQPRAHIPR